MSTAPNLPISDTIVYPSRDGQRMADNTIQARWIALLYGNLNALYMDEPNVLVGADNLWYPIQGEPEIRIAPDVFVVFGRPKGDRPSYQQWKEGDVPLTVVFEILSPSNTFQEMADKQEFYERHGVEEYYLYEPETNHLMGFVRQGDVLKRIRKMNHFISPRMGIRFELTAPEITVYYPDGSTFLTFEQLNRLRYMLQKRAESAEKRAESAEKRAESAEKSAARLALLSRKARLGQISAEELSELEQLENQTRHPQPPDLFSSP